MKRFILICLLLPMLAGCIPVQQAAQNQLDDVKVCVVDLVATKDVEAAKGCFAQVAINGGTEILMEQLGQYLSDSEMEFVNLIWAILRPLIPDNMTLTSYAYRSLDDARQEDARELVLAEFGQWLSSP
jgi:hypothetical protein